MLSRSTGAKSARSTRRLRALRPMSGAHWCVVDELLHHCVPVAAEADVEV